MSQKRAKRARQAVRFQRDAQKLLAQETRPPCDSCAFRDPTAWLSDLRMPEKIEECLTVKVHRFFCHQGMTTQTTLDADGTQGEYLVPRTATGAVDTSQMIPCGGFARWALHHDVQDIPALQRHMFRRFLDSDHAEAAAIRAACGNRADLLQKALNRGVATGELAKGVI